MNNMETVQENNVTEYLEHNKALEQSPEFQKIEQEVDNEVYRLFALERIQLEEQYIAEYGDYEEPECNYDNEYGDEPIFSDGAPTATDDESLMSNEIDDEFARYEKYLRKGSNRIKEAKRLLEMYPDKPEHAARLFKQLGSCHRIWAMKKQILKEKYGITWYTPAELNPDVIFD